MDRRLLDEFRSRCTFHGVAELSHDRNNKILVAFWALTIICGLGAGTFCCGRIIAQYIASPITITYKQADGSTSDATQFPEVMICLYNRYNRSKVDSIKLSDELLEHINMAFHNHQGFHTLKFQSAKDEYKKQIGLRQLANNSELLYHFLESKNVTFSQMLESISYDCKNIIKHCSFYGPDCCDVITSIMTTFGRCFNIRHNTYKRDPPYISLALDVPKKWFEGLLGKHEHGIEIFMYHKGRRYTDPIRLPSGVDARINLQPTCHRYMQTQHHQCDPDPTMHHFNCMNKCWYENPMTYCGCRMLVGLVVNASLPYCRPIDIQSCFQKRLRSDQFYNCSKACMPCYFCEAAQTVSTVILDPFIMAQYDGQRNQTAYENYVMLEIKKYPDYALIEQIPSKTIEEFIAELGGQFGLWIGGSILSIVQLLIFILRSCTSFMRNNQRCRSQSSRNGMQRRNGLTDT